MREFHSEISSKLFGIVLENQQPIFSRNKRGERTRGFDQRKTQFTRGIDRFFRVFLNRHMGKARYVKRCYWKMVQMFILLQIQSCIYDYFKPFQRPNEKIVLEDQEKFKWASDWTLSEDFDQCPLLTASTIDEYFTGLLSYFDWLYDGCSTLRGWTRGRITNHHYWRTQSLRTTVEKWLSDRGVDVNTLE